MLVTAPRRLGRIGPAATAVVGVFGAALLWLADPGEVAGYPSCPFFSLTGLYCPGCGSLRGLGRLVHGDLAGAIGFNVLLVLTLPVLLVVWAAWAFPTRVGHRVPRSWEVPAGWIMGFFGLSLVFGIARNLEPLSALAP